MNKQMTKQEYQKTEILTYRIAFGGDGSLYSVSFKAAMDRLEMNRVLAAAHNSLYEKLPEAIRHCLDSSCLEYSDFVSCAASMEHEKIMTFADILLHSSSCDSLDRLAGGADIYYGIMDYQHQAGSGCCEGCYYAIAKMPSVQNGTYEYHTICQTFNYNERTSREQSHFSIRKGDGRHMDTLDEEDGYPVLATFGCVDMLRLLSHIQSVTTKEKAAEIANR